MTLGSEFQRDKAMKKRDEAYKELSKVQRELEELKGVLATLDRVHAQEMAGFETLHNITNVQCSRLAVYRDAVKSIDWDIIARELAFAARDNLSNSPNKMRVLARLLQHVEKAKDIFIDIDQAAKQYQKVPDMCVVVNRNQLKPGI